jgi:pyruvate formate lyase activating enzyme
MPWMDAFVVGLKGFDNDFYSKYIGCELGHVKKSLKTLAGNREKTWIEIVNLLIPGLNDNTETIGGMCNWIKNDLGHDIPLHFTRFEPAYKMQDIPATPVKTIEKAYNTAKETGLQHVYIGNIPGHEGNNTYCPACNKKLIERVNYTVIKNRLKNGTCTCGYKLPGNWLQ